MNDRDYDEARRRNAVPPLGQLPGINQTPVNPSLRDTPRREPDARPWLRLVAAGAIVVLIVAIALFTDLL